MSKVFPSLCYNCVVHVLGFTDLQCFHFVFNEAPLKRLKTLRRGLEQSLRGTENPSLALSPVKSSQMGLAFILIYIASWE